MTKETLEILEKLRNYPPKLYNVYITIYYKFFLKPYKSNSVFLIMKVNVHPDVGAKMAEAERSKWETIRDLEGSVFSSLHDLVELIHDDHYEVERAVAIPHFEAYVRRSKTNDKDRKLIAYGCPSCEQIVVGQPEIRPIDEVGDLKSKCGYDMACRKCGNLIYHEDYLAK